MVQSFNTRFLVISTMTFTKPSKFNAIKKMIILLSTVVVFSGFFVPPISSFNGYADDFEGTSGPDDIEGTDGDYNIDSGDRADTNSGGDGNDKIKAGEGDDTLTGGTGGDKFNCGKGIDTITDFSAAQGDKNSGNCKK